MASDALLLWVNDLDRKHGFTSMSGGAAQGTTTGTPAALEEEYSKLGGDLALLELLGGEDDLFRTALEKKRALAKKWHRDRVANLKFGQELRGDKIAELEKETPLEEAWIARESAIQESLATQIDGLGDKLQTEPGQELLYGIRNGGDRIGQMRDRLEHERRWLAKAQPTLELMEARLGDVNATYERIEQRIRDTRVESDNVLEMKAMSLAEKVGRLRGGKQQKATQQKLEKEIEAIVEKKYAEDLEKSTNYLPPHASPGLEPMDWAPIRQKLARVSAASKEDLEKPDPALAKLRKKYDKAGGDDALYRKRVLEWKKILESRKGSEAFDERQHRHEQEELQERITGASLGLLETERELTEMKARRDRSKARLEKAPAEAAAGEAVTEQEAAELQLMARELKHLDKDIANREALLPPLRESKKNAELLLEKERQIYEVKADKDTRRHLREPWPEDLYDIPLRAKYAELVKN